MDKGLIGKILLVVGAYYVVFPHSIHMMYSPDYLLGLGQAHMVHVIFGIALAVYGIYLGKLIKVDY